MREAVERSTEARLLVEAGKWQQASDAAMEHLRRQAQVAIESVRVEAAVPCETVQKLRGEPANYGITLVS